MGVMLSLFVWVLIAAVGFGVGGWTVMRTLVLSLYAYVYVLLDESLQEVRGWMDGCYGAG